ncbi:MAG: VTT domain-containing protein [Acidobacteria bacterium]|nr:VTT domain-containing protein [Acidobacteriota bacterium]
MRLALLAAALLALILIPFLLWEDALTAFATALITGHKTAWWIAPAIAALLAADIVLPIPSSLLATASGALLGFAAGALANFTGLTLGCLGGYYAGRPAGAKLLKENEKQRLETLWQKYGDWTIVLTRAVPVLAEAAAVFAGASRMETKRFFKFTALANAGVAILYAAIGAFAMSANSFLAAFIGSLLLPAIAMGIMRKR